MVLKVALLRLGLSEEATKGAEVYGAAEGQQRSAGGHRDGPDADERVQSMRVMLMQQAGEKDVLAV